jgi:hypothetical protein
MRIGVPRETASRERRVALMPAAVARLAKLGAEVVVEQGAGASAFVPDAQYAEAGARLVPAADAFGADLVSLIIEGNGSLCGLGYLMLTESAGFEANAFSVSARNCATGNYTFSHEMGHNMGLQHDRIAQPANGVFPH